MFRSLTSIHKRIPLRSTSHVHFFSTTFNPSKQVIVKSRFSLPELKSDIVKKPLPRYVLDSFLSPEKVDLVSSVDGFTKKELTFGETYYSCYSLADSLKDYGLQKGDRVAIMSPNHLYYLTCLMGINLTGAAVTPINPLYVEKEIEYQLEATKAKVIFTHPMCAEKVIEVTKAMGLKVIIMDQDVGNAEGLKAMVENSNGRVSLMTSMYTTKPFQKTRYDHNGYLEKVHDPEDVASIPFSSGTTGRSKGVLLTHKNLIANIIQSIEMEGKYLYPTATSERGSLLIPLPFFHIYGFTVGLVMPHVIGAKLVFMPQFDLKVYLELVQQHKISRGLVVPPIVLALAKHPLIDSFDLSSLRSLTSGAAPLGADIQVAAAKRLNCIIKQGWGMTECSPAGTITPDWMVESVEKLHGTSGQLTPDSEGKIVDPQTGEDLPYDQEGELFLRGPQVMKGYLDNEEATKETLTEDGWLRTGDIGYFDDNGWLYLKDRLKELIKYKGFQVPPADLEALIATMPQVKDVIVIPVPDDEAGEVPRAYVVKQDNVSEDFKEEDVVKFVEKNVAPHKRLRGGVVFAASVPKSPSGKLLRRVQIDIDRQMNAK